ncbi:MAG: hypothetical protein VKP62_12940 [Candidatus Sericytochromatia bacterium]|nr:hypothetical protein [Candidatus Sericytochromatia bacterium]
MRWTIFTGVGLAILAACGSQVPNWRGALSAVQAPAPLAGSRARPTARIEIDLTRPLHAASPYVNGYNRNHNHRQFRVHGFDRQAFLQALQALAPRWGQRYQAELQQAGYPARSQRRGLYRTGHGPTDGRHDYWYLTGYRFLENWGRDGQDSTWDGYPYDDLRYSLQEATEAEAEPLVTINFGTDTPEAAGNLAAWLNGARSELRVQWPPFSGAQSAPPDGAFLFEIGNEVQLRVVRGHEKARDIARYVANAAPYVRQVRQASPHPVKVALAAAVNVFWGGPHDPLRDTFWSQQGQMVRDFIQAAQREGIRFDALQLHGYPSYPVGEKLAGNAYLAELMAREIMPALAQAPYPIEIWNDEFHAASGLPRNTGMYGALYAADAVVTAFNLSRNGRQLMPITTDFAAWHAGRGGASDSLYFPENQVAQPSPIYTFRRWLAHHWGDTIVTSQVQNVGFWEDVGADGSRTRVSLLHVAAAQRQDGGVTLLVVNRSRQPVQAQLVLKGSSRPETRGRRYTLQPRPGLTDPWNAAWNEVERLEADELDLAGGISFPAASVTFLVAPPMTTRGLSGR